MESTENVILPLTTSKKLSNNFVQPLNTNFFNSHLSNTIILKAGSNYNYVLPTASVLLEYLGTTASVQSGDVFALEFLCLPNSSGTISSSPAPGNSAQTYVIPTSSTSQMLYLTLQFTFHTDQFGTFIPTYLFV